MTIDEAIKIQRRNDGGEFLNFDRIAKPFSTRADLHAFLLLDDMSTNSCNTQDIIAWAGHDEIYLCFEWEDVEDAMTEERVIDLHRCGVSIDHEGFHMFV